MSIDPRAPRTRARRDIDRRAFLNATSKGLGALTLGNLLCRSGNASTGSPPALHHTPRAKSVILLYMSGGVSHVDSFDPKPLLRARHGKPLPMRIERTQFDQNGNLMASPWRERPYGESGLVLTNLFEEIATCADDLAIVRSMTTPFSEHAQANFFMHTGFPFLGYPSAGSWVTYGTGTSNANLPGYIVLRSRNAHIPHGGVSLFGNAFLPPTTQASIFDLDAKGAVPHLTPQVQDREQRRALALMAKLDRTFADRTAARDAVLAAAQNREIAYEMQRAVPELVDLSKEPESMHVFYGTNSKNRQEAEYARQCLTARRLVEHGVRFIELSCCTVNIGAGGAGNPWDQHGDLERGHGAMARQVDRPIAALLRDLKRRGLLEETLVVFTGEFGRTPFAQGSGGRDHDPFGFSLWLAGAGVKGGTVRGSTDEFGYQAVEHVSTVYDLWATVLHLLGIDHERLTFRHGGRDLRLTDVHGRVWHDLLETP